MRLTSMALLLLSSSTAVTTGSNSPAGVQEGSRVSGPQSAKLKRFAAALKLDDKHHTALVQSAAAHNMEVGNFG